MNWGKTFAWAIMALDLCASLGYVFAHDWRRGLMWFCYALATLAVTI